MSAYSIGLVESSICDVNTVEEAVIIAQKHHRTANTLLEPQDDDAKSHGEHIGPITRLNSDVLMDIFEFSSEVYWMAPLSISRVCREWRSIILATPKAWMNLYLAARPPRNIVSLYVTRSQPLPLHIVTPCATRYRPGDSSVPYLKVINDIALRVECLHILSKELPFLTGQFSSLRRLHLSGPRTRSGETGDRHVDVNFSMFPRLCHLYLEDVIAPSTRSYHAPTFPKIQQLALCTDHRHRWYKFIKFVAKNLVSLHLHMLCASESTAVKPLRLPVLRYLHLVNASYDDWEFAANTPSLLSYIPLRAFAPGRRSWDPKAPLLVNVDIAQVTHLRLLEDVDLSPYATLRYLQIRFPPENIIQRLERNLNLCQELETIESLIDYGEPPTATKIDREILGVTKQIRIIKTGSWNLEFPFHMTKACTGGRNCSPGKN